MLRALLATALALPLAAPALAGGTAPPAAPPVVVPAQPVSDWGGFYGGVQLEYGEATASLGPFSADFDGTGYGVFAGYRVDYGNLVFGSEIDILGTDISNAGTNIDRVIRSTLELGYDAGDALIYGTAGIFAATVSPAVALGDTDWGTVAGVGVDYRIGASTFLSAELLYHSIDNFLSTGVDIEVTTFGVGIGFEF